MSSPAAPPAGVLPQKAERDPRINPQAGDRLRKKYQGRLFEAHGYIEREVDEVYEATEGGTFVVYVGDNVCTPEISIKPWRRWAKDAKVLWRSGVSGAQGALQRAAAGNSVVSD